jgi:hypothetical protein
VVCRRNKIELSKGNQNVIFRSTQDQEKLTALTVKRPESKCSGKELFVRLTEASLLC